MFRRCDGTLQPDSSVPADLRSLGFFINDVGQIRMIDAPEKEFFYNATNNDRYNEMRREAFQECERREVESRLSALGVERLYFPDLENTKPNGPHVPILCTPFELLRTRKRVIVLVNDSVQDPGILSYRQLQQELGVNGGSTVNFLKEIINRSATVRNDKDLAMTSEMDGDSAATGDSTGVPGLIVMNTAQLLYSHKTNRALSLRSWCALPRKSIAHEAIKIHEEENRVDGHRSPREHIKSLLNTIIYNPDVLAPDAEVYVIAIEDGIENIVSVLAEDFEKYGSRITAMAAIHAQVDGSQIHDASLKAFLHQRVRQWKSSDLTGDPTHCTELPTGYMEELPSAPSKRGVFSSNPTHINWLEVIPNPGFVSTFKAAVNNLVHSEPSLKDTRTDSSQKENGQQTQSAETLWITNPTVICPTFSGGSGSSAERVFTDPKVQQAILSFFEEVAQDPKNYRNPSFSVYSEAPHPTPEDPLSFAAYKNQPIESLPEEMSPERYDLDNARLRLSTLKASLEACPTDVPELDQGRARLKQKIQVKEKEIEDLEKKALATGGLPAGEGEEARADWVPEAEGPKVPFAGTMVDSELLKAAGLGETAEEELRKLG